MDRDDGHIFSPGGSVRPGALPTPSHRPPTPASGGIELSSTPHHGRLAQLHDAHAAAHHGAAGTAGAGGGAHGGAGPTPLPSPPVGEETGEHGRLHHGHVEMLTPGSSSARRQGSFRFPHAGTPHQPHGTDGSTAGGHGHGHGSTGAGVLHGVSPGNPTRPGLVRRQSSRLMVHRQHSRHTLDRPHTLPPLQASSDRAYSPNAGGGAGDGSRNNSASVRRPSGSIAVRRTTGSFRGQYTFQQNAHSLFVKNADFYAVQEVDGCASWGMINPQNQYKEMWDFFISVLVLYICWAEPYLVAFPAPAWETKGAHIWEYIIDALFYTDIILNFRTGFLHGTDIVMDPKEVAKHYGGSWFLVDLVGSFEWELVLDGISHSQRTTIKISKVFKLAKLLRMGRLVRWMRSFFKFRHFMVWFFAFVYCTHWTACIWFIIETESDGTRYRRVESGEYKAGNLYWEVLDDVFLHMHGVHAARRYSEFHHFFSLVARFIGFTFEVTLGALFVPLLMLWAGSHTKFRQHVEAVDEAMEDLAIPDHLRQRINKYYDYLWLNKKYDNSGAVFYTDHLLSDSLKKEVARELARVSIPWKSFKYSADVPEDALAALVMAMKTHIFMPNDVITRKGEIGREMYYLVKGSVEFHFNPEQHSAPPQVTVAEPGQFFGEMALLSDERRHCTIRASTFVELMVLAKEDLFDMMNDYPDLARMLVKMAAEHFGGHHASVVKEVEDRLSPFLRILRNRRRAEKRQQHHADTLTASAGKGTATGGAQGGTTAGASAAPGLGPAPSAPPASGPAPSAGAGASGSASSGGAATSIPVPARTHAGNASGTDDVMPGSAGSRGSSASLEGITIHSVDSKLPPELSLLTGLPPISDADEPVSESNRSRLNSRAVPGLASGGSPPLRSSIPNAAPPTASISAAATATAAGASAASTASSASASVSAPAVAAADRPAGLRISESFRASLSGTRSAAHTALSDVLGNTPPLLARPMHVVGAGLSPVVEGAAAPTVVSASAAAAAGAAAAAPVTFVAAGSSPAPALVIPAIAQPNIVVVTPADAGAAAAAAGPGVAVAAPVPVAAAANPVSSLLLVPPSLPPPLPLSAFAGSARPVGSAGAGAGASAGANANADSAVAMESRMRRMEHTLEQILEQLKQAQTEDKTRHEVLRRRNAKYL